MLNERAFDLGRVDVEATHDDHVVGPIVEEQEAVVVEVTDIADGEEIVEPCGLGLLVVALVLELLATAHLHVHGAGLERRQPVAVLVDDDHLRDRPRLADRAGLGHPLGRSDIRAAALGSGVVLPDRVAPPFDHLLLGFDRAWCRRMDHVAGR